MMTGRGARSILAALVVAVSVGSSAAAQSSQLGRVEFPNSGSAAAQPHFLRGLAALHSFWYEAALDAFREATRVDPDFALGYWGEAMAYNHPLWSEQDADSARKALAKIKDEARLSERERMYIAAVRALYGSGDKPARDLAYAEAMEKLYLAYPDDLEAAAFYSLALLGSVRPGEKGYRKQMKAGAIALEVYKKNPDHPGAAHYIIHAFDDPEHAILALPAAYRYAEIAPDAHHARHMPSHIFLQLGMWPEAAASNEAAWRVSDEWVKRDKLSLSLRDYHSLHWLLYVYLQQGRQSKAMELLDMMRTSLAEPEANRFRPGYLTSNYATMASTFAIETENWNQVAELFKPLSERGEEGEDGHGAHAMCARPAGDVTVRRTNRGQAMPMFTRAMAAISLGNGERAMALAGEIRKLGSGNVEEIRALTVEATAHAARKEYDRAIELMTRAVQLEEEMSPPSGPPVLLKPAHERFGEILLAAGRPREAGEQFARSLLRQPNRARSLLGAARAAARAGDAPRATALYSQFLKQWQQADARLPELAEARDYLKGARAQ